MNRSFLLGILVGLWLPAWSADAQQSRSAPLLASAQDQHAIAEAEKRLAGRPDDSRLKLVAADLCLRGGAIERSIELFDDYLKDHPDAKPYLWQRGISLALAGKYKAGAEQFESHRKVNPHDVENPAWHYLCVAKSTSADRANRMVLPAPSDARVPMAEIHQMLTTGDVQAVQLRISSLQPEDPNTKNAVFYGRLYLGLYADANGDKKVAIEHLKECVRDAPKHYMGDVARVYLKTLTQ